MSDNLLTDHPLQPYLHDMECLGLIPLEKARDLPPGSEMRCAVLVTELKEVITKRKGGTHGLCECGRFERSCGNHLFSEGVP